MTASASLLAAVATGAAALTWWRPAWAICGLLACLPFAAHRTVTTPALWLIAVVCVVEVTYLVRTRPRWSSLVRVVAREPLVLLSTLFAAAAVASLSALPLASMWRDARWATQAPAYAEWSALLAAVGHLGEGLREFSITATLLTAQAVGLMVIVWRETRGAPERAVQFGTAIVAGAVASVTLGAMELAGVLDLEALRGTVSVSVRSGTMQSTAGNPGWFTQYVAYALPYGLVALATPVATRWRLTLLVAFSAVMLAALALGFQRGGWVTGVVGIAYVLLSTRILLGAGGGSIRRAGLTGLVAIVGITLVVAVAVTWRVRTSSAEGGAPSLAAYTERLRSLADGDRLPYVRAAVLIWELHPILGGGHESFAYRYQQYFEAPGGRYATDTTRVPDPSSAHSLYLQTLTGTGAGGLALLLALLATAAATAWKTVRAPHTEQARRAVVLAAAGSLLAVSIYGLVQEVFYVHALRLLFFVGLGMVAGLAPGVLRWPPAAALGVAATLAVVSVLHVGYEHVWADPGRVLGNLPAGLYDAEPLSAEVSYRWTTDEASWPVPEGATTIDMDVRSLAPFPQQLSLATCRGEAIVTLRDHNWHHISQRLHGCRPRDRVIMRIRPSWRPPADARLLGVMTSQVTLK